MGNNPVGNAAQQENFGAPPLAPTTACESYEGAECDEGDDVRAKVQESRCVETRLSIARNAIHRVLYFKPTKSKLSKCTFGEVK